MLALLANNPLLIVAGLIISIELFALITMVMMLIFHYTMQTVINDPHGHYAIAKSVAHKSAVVAKDRTAGVRSAIGSMDFVRVATAYDYEGKLRATAGQVYRLAVKLNSAEPSVKPRQARMELPTFGMRKIVVPSNKDRAAIMTTIPPVPDRKPSVYPSAKVEQSINA